MVKCTCAFNEISSRKNKKCEKLQQIAKLNSKLENQPLHSRCLSWHQSNPKYARSRILH